jgi:predicted regulator of Ras-like GTPase activity (Roadblock/LC7/MglB family)
MEDLFREAADRMVDILIIGVADMDGRCIAAHSPVGMDRSVFAARMAAFMDKLVDPLHEMNGCDGLREAIMLTDKGWVAWRRLASDACLGIMTGEDCTRGQVQRLLDEAAGKLAGLLN